jgi:hypothetical protein
LLRGTISGMGPAGSGNFSSLASLQASTQAPQAMHRLRSRSVHRSSPAAAARAFGTPAMAAAPAVSNPALIKDRRVKVVGIVNTPFFV